ncbi:MAG: CDP-alcohol phosphatidyltransferase family protein [Crocinitomicaceae bacterium]
MSKLPKQHQFLDLSDYGRPFAVIIATRLISTKITPIHVTFGFFIAGCLAVLFMFMHLNWLALLFLILKSILDAADGTLARLRNTPSYVGRYLDSIADIILNFIILCSVGWLCSTPTLFVVLAFAGMQLQGTLYNYYYVIMRNKLNGDSTSRIFENKIPEALLGEKQKHVNILFLVYKLLYGIFDKTIYLLDSNASNQQSFPKWFMTLVSTNGLGFQLLIIGILLILNLTHFIIPFFMFYSVAIFIFIGIRILINSRFYAQN